MCGNIYNLLMKKTNSFVVFKSLVISEIRLRIFLYEKRLETLREITRNSTEIGGILYDKQIGCL